MNPRMNPPRGPGGLGPGIGPGYGGGGVIGNGGNLMKSIYVFTSYLTNRPITLQALTVPEEECRRWEWADDLSGNQEHR